MALERRMSQTREGKQDVDCGKEGGASQVEKPKVA